MSLVPAGNSGIESFNPTSTSVLPRQTGKAIARVQHETVVRLAHVQAEALVTTEKSQEVDRVAKVAMLGQAELHEWTNTLASNNPLMVDELRPFAELAKLGKVELLSDLVMKYRRQ